MKEFGLDNWSNERARSFLRSRAQAHFRHESWELTRPQYFQFWNTPELWKQRGRQRLSLVLTRKDSEKPWSIKNCCISMGLLILYDRDAY